MYVRKSRVTDRVGNSAEICLNLKVTAFTYNTKHIQLLVLPLFVFWFQVFVITKQKECLEAHKKNSKARRTKILIS